MSMMHFEPFRSFRDLDRLSSQLLSGTRTPLGMPMDVWREGQAYHVALDVPGVDADSIDLQVERNTLTVTAQRSPLFRGAQQQGGQGGGQAPGAGQGDDGSSVLVAERPMGTFTRQLVLGEGLDTTGVQADYTDGVLHLTIPLAQQAQPRRIQVGQGGRAGQGGGQPQVIQGTTTQTGPVAQGPTGEGGGQ